MPIQIPTQQGEAKLPILNLKTPWREFQKPGQTAATQGEAQVLMYNPRVSPKQFCASAHLGCTHAAGTSQYDLFMLKHPLFLYTTSI